MTVWHLPVNINFFGQFTVNSELAIAHLEDIGWVALDEFDTDARQYPHSHQFLDFTVFACAEVGNDAFFLGLALA